VSVISNTTVIINFAAIGQLELLRQLFGILHLPTEVYAEIRDGQTEGYAYLNDITQLIAPLTSDGWLHLVSLHDDAELRRYAALPAGLHHGEAACLAIASQRDWLLLTDDRAARAEARRQQIRLSGSIGCLVMAAERGIISLPQANSYLAAMIAQGYHAPLTDLSSLLGGAR
jgi:predicted nucleic acid-binding protein